MKSFLHRVAASAVRPQPSLHPFVESIYPTAINRQPSEPQLQFESAIARGPAGHTAERIPPSRLSGEQGQPLISPTVAQMEHTPPASQEVYRPLVPQSVTAARIAKQFSGSVPEPASSASISEQSTSASQQTQTASRQGRAEMRLPAVSEYVPIVNPASPAGINATQPQSLGEIQAALTRATPRSQSPQFPPASRPAPQPADDIQIHIGRIEVIAVPPPAPRAQAAPSRKGLSLDEYLSRRNGRLG